MPRKKTKVKVEMVRKSPLTAIIDLSGTDDLLKALNETIVAAIGAKSSIENLNECINNLNTVKIQYKLTKDG